MRQGDIDFVKCVCITLMVVFHLQYIGDSYPVAKQMVYTFHMPIFLFLSGFLLNTERGAASFFRKYRRVLIPYLIMEGCYAVASSFLPVRGGLGELSAGSLLRALCLKPVGPYWYLHTFMLCSALSFFTLKAFDSLLQRYALSRLPHLLVRLLALCLIFLWLAGASLLELVHLPYALYFLAGVAVRWCNVGFHRLFKPGLIGVVPLVALCCFPANRHAESVGGCFICYFMLGGLLAVYRLLPLRVKTVTGFIGTHTLAILLFSPVFTMAAKYLLPLFRFEPTGMLFLCAATALAIGGSLAIEWGMRLTGLSRYFFGK